MKPTAQNLTSLASLYNVSRDSMRTWLKKAKLYKNPKKDGYLYTPKEVKVIFEHLGEP